MSSNNCDFEPEELLQDLSVMSEEDVVFTTKIEDIVISLPDDIRAQLEGLKNSDSAKELSGENDVFSLHEKYVLESTWLENKASNVLQDYNKAIVDLKKVAVIEKSFEEKRNNQFVEEYAE
eukprot:Awhi_evm1s221